nr:hypothetical protein [Vicinamibacterales bacterium]
SRPSAGATPKGGSRPAAGERAPSRPAGAAAARPTQGQVKDFLNAPSGAAAGRAGAGATGNAKARMDAAQSTAGNAVSNFLDNGGTAKAGAAAGAAAATASGGNTVAGNRGDAIGNRTEARSDARGSRGENREFASDNRQDRVAGRGDQQAVRVAERGETRSDLAAGRGERRTDRQQMLGEHADSIRNELNNAYNSDLHDDFWSGLQTGHYYFDKNPIFWTWAGFNTVSALMPWNWGAGRYYDYGSGGSSYYDGSTVMVGDEAVPVEEYAQQAQELAMSVPEENDEASDAAGEDWLPLGVFAIAQEGEDAEPPTMFLQLAIRNDGVIAGTYQNKATGETAAVEGMVDQESQRAAWAFTGRTSPIVETGIQNLTMNETQILVHFDDRTETYLMVRVENPEA